MRTQVPNPARFLTLVAILLAVPALPAMAQLVHLRLSNPGPRGGSITSVSPPISCTGTCNVELAVGTTVTLTAQPDLGNQVDRWSGDCSGSGPTCTLLMDGPRLAVASFRSLAGRYSLRHLFVPGGADGLGPSFNDLLLHDGFLFGTTSVGGVRNLGVIFRQKPDGSEYSILHDFVGGADDGAYPSGQLIQVDQVLYGMSSAGGARGGGTIFRLHGDGSDFAVLHSFAGYPGDGLAPQGSLLAQGGVLFGMTSQGGASFLGSVFRINPDGSGFEILHSFAGFPGDGSSPYGSLAASNGALFGMTSLGGTSDSGVIFRIETDGTGFQLLKSLENPAEPYGTPVILGSVLYGLGSTGSPSTGGAAFSMNTDGSNFQVVHELGITPGSGYEPMGSLIEVGGQLFGTTAGGGSGGSYCGAGCGTVFRFSPGDGSFQTLHAFGGGPGDGQYPYGSLVQSGGELYGMSMRGGEADAGMVFKLNADGSAYEIIHWFGDPDRADGRQPVGALATMDGALFGMTDLGGQTNRGAIYRINPDGTGHTLVRSFSGSADDGSSPYGPLTPFAGQLYGMTPWGGATASGAIFRMNPDGSGFELLHSFTPAEGNYPSGALTELGGVLFGITTYNGPIGGGSIFRVNPDGSEFQTIHAFYRNGGEGNSGSLLAYCGNLYGMTNSDGAQANGTVFRISPDGASFEVLYTFSYAWPVGSLIELDGLLYGMVTRGGGGVFRIGPDGSGFQWLHSFTGGASNGQDPRGSLTASGGLLFGTTSKGGTSDLGTVFQIRPDGSEFKLLHSFSGGDGATPISGSALTEVGGSLFGVAALGGVGESGVVFSVRIQPVVSGTVTLAGLGLAGGTLAGLPGNPVTASSGRYEAVVPAGWSGTVSARGPFAFTPASRTYTGVTSDLLGEDVTASIATDLALTMTAGFEPVAPGSQVTYAISVSDFGPSAATAVTVTDTLPTGAGFVSATASTGTCSESSGTVTCLLGDLPDGATSTVTVVVTAPAGPCLAVNSVTSTAAEPDPNTGNNIATVSTSIGVLAPAILAVDTIATAGSASNLNGLVEPGEVVVVAPRWSNPTDGSLVVTGAASVFGGPTGAVYTLGDGSADYGSIAPGQTTSCLASSDCYLLAIGAPTGRPATHWDATFLESLNGSQAKVWTVHVGASFADVSVSATAGSFYRFIETLLHSGTTVGCTATSYCPTSHVSRSQMAMFLARVMRGGSDAAVPVAGTVPGKGSYSCVPTGTSLFADVAPMSQSCRHVHFIAGQGITLGCTTSTYCPLDKVSRKALAMLVARALAGSDAAVPLFYQDPVTRRVYSCDPSQASLHFADVATTDAFCRHAHYLWAKGIVDGCSTTQYCPGSLVRRDQMAKVLVNGFGLTLGHP
jgi:uncharacterized repeat protein (TIGR01451 family)